MTDYGLVSIITPAYNSAKYIAETLDSVISQTYPNWEMLITDDCSTDNTRDIIRQYAEKDPRIKLICLEKNSGAGVARNTSIAASSGRFIAMLDSDDIWLPNKLEIQLQRMISNNVKASYASTYTMTEDGFIDGIYVAFKFQDYKNTIKGDRMGSNTFMYDTQGIGKIYMPLIRKRQDWAWKINVMKKVNYAIGLVEPLALYRKRQNSISKNKKSLIKFNILVYKEVLNMTYAKAFLKFIFQNIPNILFKKFRRKIINI